MSRNALIFGAIGVVIVFAGVIFLAQNKPSTTNVNTTPTGNTQSKEPSGDNRNEQSKVLAGTVTKLLDFSKEDYDRAVADNKIILLYFYANWCPICRVEVPNELYPAFNELQEENVIGFRVNYNDSETDEDEKALAEGFGITYQHSKVILKNGKEVLKSLDTWDKERYITEINKAAR